MQAIINYSPELPEPEQAKNFNGLKNCWLIYLPGIIVFSVDREKCLCKARKVSLILTKLNKCD